MIVQGTYIYHEFLIYIFRKNILQYVILVRRYEKQHFVSQLIVLIFGACLLQIASTYV